MLAGLRVNNFKSLKAVDIEFKPVTIIIGPNGSGKSSILQSILLLKKLHVNQGNISLSDLFNIEGYMNMGLWEQLAFDKRDPMEFCVLVKDNNISFKYNININRDGKLNADGELQLAGVTGKFPRVTINLPYSQKIVQYININIKGGILAINWNGFGANITISGSVPEDLKEKISSVINEWSKNVYFVPSPIAMYKRPSMTIQQAPSIDNIINSLKNSLVPHEDLLLLLLAIDSDLEDYVESYVEELFKIKIKTKSIPPSIVEIRSKITKGKTALIVNEGGGVNRVAFLFTVIGLADKGSTILLEEPETNLHPDAQYRLASILVEMVKKDQKQLIITTHSEHLLLGVLNSIAKGKLSLDDVAILYMYKGSNGESIAEKLEIDTHGRVKGGLPGFFETEIEELLGMVAPKVVG
jgi:predicted ATPase